MSKRVKNIQSEVLSDRWATLSAVSFDYQDQKGQWSRIKREVYDRGNGACALLYNTKEKTVILIKQFRLPAYLNNDDGFLIEACAGVIEKETPEQTILREIEEETGYSIKEVTYVMDVFMTPGAVTERVHLFLAAYVPSQRKTTGGGLEIENEDIEVIEYAFDKALKDLKNGTIKDAKTVILLQHLALSGLMD